MAHTHRILDGITTLHNQYDILVMGGKNVGKTTLIYKFLNCPLPTQRETGDELHVKMIDIHLQSPQCTSASSVTSTYAEITILDASSSGESYATSRSQQVRNAHAVMFVYNVGNRDSFEALEYMMEGVMVMCSDAPPPFVVVALELGNNTEYQVLDYEGEELASRVGALKFFEVSISYDEEVKCAFHTLVDEVLKRKAQLAPAGLDEQLSRAQAPQTQDRDGLRLSESMALVSAPVIAETAACRSSTYSSLTKAPSVKSLTEKGPSKSFEKHRASMGLEKQPDAKSISPSIANRASTRASHEPKPQSGCCVIV